MKDFRSKMQSLFPAIPKNSESPLEWEEALKSKWDEHGEGSLTRSFWKGQLRRCHRSKGTRSICHQEHGRCRPSPWARRPVFSVHTEGRQSVCFTLKLRWACVCIRFSQNQEDCLKNHYMDNLSVETIPGEILLFITAEANFCTWTKTYNNIWWEIFIDRLLTSPVPQCVKLNEFQQRFLSACDRQGWKGLLLLGQFQNNRVTGKPCMSGGRCGSVVLNLQSWLCTC